VLHPWASTRGSSCSPASLHVEDVADAVVHIVTRDRRLADNEVITRAAEQTW
jgi:hypothetical protein